MKVVIIRTNNLQLSVVTEVTWNLCADHFAIYTNLEALCCTPEINTMLGQSYLNVKKKKNPQGSNESERVGKYTENKHINDLRHNSAWYQVDNY